MVSEEVSQTLASCSAVPISAQCLPIAGGQTVKSIFCKSLYNIALSLTVLLVVIGPVSTHAQTFTMLYLFSGSDGAFPYYGPLVQGFDGNFYGTTSEGSTSGGFGTIFRITPEGVLTNLHMFNSADGSIPYAGLVQGTDGNLYGTTAFGGLYQGGTIFRITYGGRLTTIYNFCVLTNCTDGASPRGGLIQAVDGNLYGTTYQGGIYGAGTVFRITAKGTLTSLHSFDIAHGGYPFAGLVQGSDGNFYGTANAGGRRPGYGVVFKITRAGTETVLHEFNLADGAYPFAPLALGTDGNFYGTTSYGAGYNQGSVFSITARGQFTNLDSLSSPSKPFGGLVQGTDGNFYGTGSVGSSGGFGGIFQITSAGTFTTLFGFNYQNGSSPFATLLQATNGAFYGTTAGGGSTGDGTIFSLSTGLAPFVKSVPNAGRVGIHVNILGNSLTGTTSVTFNGTPATFIVVSDTQIRAIVPSGATTGQVDVTTPTAQLTSNIPFQVIP